MERSASRAVAWRWTWPDMGGVTGAITRPPRECGSGRGVPAGTSDDRPSLASSALQPGPLPPSLGSWKQRRDNDLVAVVAEGC